LLKHQIPVKTEAWDVRVPGFTEVDLVSHSGHAASGDFAYSLNLTDLHTTWTETRAVLGKGETAVVEAFQDIQAALPFRLLGIDSDNGSEFINWHLGRWCAKRDIQFTRSRPYKKDDNAHIEQKNWTHVRKLLAWDATTRAGRGGDQRSVPERTAPVDESVSALGEAREENPRGLQAAPQVQRRTHAPRPSPGFPAHRSAAG
jgi:hypothetical protein